ncbi:MAG: serine hydrolase [Acidobacteria bacterium]|nr:serine hydrolase [Acidobacteriota bacterium]
MTRVFTVGVVAIAAAALLIGLSGAEQAAGPDTLASPSVEPLFAEASVEAEDSVPAPPLNFDVVDEEARALPRLHSLLVSRRGELLFERYYNGIRPERPANIKSASKSVISALVGIAIERGLIPGVDTPIATYFPELARDADPRKREITVEHLLTMRPGLEGTSNRNYGAWVLSRNWVRHVLARPMFAEPGEAMEYSTGNTHLLSAILTKVSKTSTWQFANEVLARPLGFPLTQWPRDPQGIYFGGNDMLMTPRQLLAVGELYLNDGRANGQQIVPAAWVDKSCEGRERGPRRRPQGPGLRPQSDFDGPPDGFLDPTRDRRYGYLWWVREFAGHETCFAWGYGGQYVFVVPDLELVVVATSSADVSEERRGHRRSLFEIVEGLVMEPIAAQARVAAPAHENRARTLKRALYRWRIHSPVERRL